MGLISFPPSTFFPFGLLPLLLLLPFKRPSSTSFTNHILGNCQSLPNQDPSNFFLALRETDLTCLEFWFCTTIDRGYPYYSIHTPIAAQLARITSVEIPYNAIEYIKYYSIHGIGSPAYLCTESV
ncbi:hypothetical protein BDV24DRAFT_21113 [Aspergillus arachidicola]|uniref:Uncharacterized protein n=1 Tax=Aspergillus arachidicola TaxID=656916 RepID=A0A5N6YGB5_9EURO|nr:hypothetical protein BDV24DRAFT_21113 [Aspergillus arachidicola]